MVVGIQQVLVQLEKVRLNYIHLQLVALLVGHLSTLDLIAACLH